MSPRCRRALSLFAFGIGVWLLAPPSGSEALAQRKGGFGGQKEGRAKEEPPPNLTLPEDWAKAFTWRSIGPANMGGRITALAVYEADPTTYWVATASGGLLKTTNNGVTFEHQFDQEATVSIGDVCVAPSDKNIVWVGTGENNPRNSRLLRRRRLQVHRRRQDLEEHGPEEDVPDRQDPRSTRRTRTSSTSAPWAGCTARTRSAACSRRPTAARPGRRSCYVDDNTGVIDMRMHPTDPDTLLVATWERQRDEFDTWPGGDLPDGYDAYDPVEEVGPGRGHLQDHRRRQDVQEADQGAADRASSAGSAWTIYRKDPNVVFAIIDCEKIGMGTPPKKAAAAATAYLGMHRRGRRGRRRAQAHRVVAGRPGRQGRAKADDVITKIGDKAVKTYEDLIEADPRREARRQGEARGQARRQGRRRSS